MIVVVVTIGDVPSTKQHPAFYRPDAVLIGGGAVGQRGQLTPHLQTRVGANGIKCPHFADLVE